MDVTKDDLKTLSEPGRAVAVSIFMPTHEAGAATRENHIRFKNRLQEAGELLVARGYNAPDAEAFLSDAQNLVDDNNFWQHQRKGLAFFIGEEGTFQYRLPLAPEELTVVSDRFHLKPLLPLLTDDGRFYILAMSLNSARLLEATRYSVSEVPLEGLPTSMAEALRFDDDPEPTLRAYATAGSQGGGTPLGTQGAEEVDRKEDILRFFKVFDNGLRKMLEPQGDRIPVVFAGNVTNFPIYQEANHYKGLMDEFVEINLEGTDDDTLHARAWEVVAPHFEARRGRDAEAFMVKSSSDPAHTSADLTDVVTSAHDSRIQTLFVPLGDHRWGRYDPEARTAEFHDERGPDDSDLYDLAAVQTLLGGGTVYAAQPSEIPGGGEVAAVYRF